MTYYEQPGGDHNDAYVGAFFDAVQRDTERITADPATARISDAVGAYSQVSELDRVARGRAQVAGARLRGGRDSGNAPDVVHQLADQATSCHVQSAGLWQGDYPHGALVHDPEVLRSRLSIRRNRPGL